MSYSPEIRFVQASVFLFTLLVSVAARAQSAEGLWQSDGYGLLVEVRGSKMNAFELTSISCLPAWSAELDASRSNAHSAVFAMEQGAVTISPGPADDKKSMYLNFSVSTIRLNRLHQRPSTCSAATADTPQNNYAIFWHTFAEQYALFPKYQVDWDAVDRHYRPLVRAETSPEDLFRILSEMVDPFHNAHIDIRAKSIQREYWGYKPASDVLQSKHADSITRIIESNYIHSRMKSYCNGNVEYGFADSSIGLLRILSFENYTGSMLESALDEIFARSSQLQGLIIDVRINEGGSDAFGLAIASRLTRSSYFAYSKTVRKSSKGGLSFTDPEAIWVKTTSRPGFLGNVVLLEGPDTFSAGETFAMALMNRKPTVVRVGEDTQGVFSDKLRRRLPNGWLFALPNEVYLTQKGEAYDVRGVPPDIRIPVFDSNDVGRGRDAGIEKAQELLARKQNENKSQSSEDRP